MPKFLRRTYLFFCTDPVHVGTGGYRLGRVDNSMVREPGTNVPKVPGTSLHGAARAYSASIYEKPECAGQGQPDQKTNNPGHCGTCKICYTFGFTTSTQNSQPARSGAVNVFDALVLLFPVHSMHGPLWITTRSRLEAAGFDVPEPSPETILPVFQHEGKLNLGWLMFDTGRKITMVPRKLDLFNVNCDQRWKEIADKIVVVHESIFSHLVNSNMEVRTSVSIDPFRGAAVDKALFTYEALPRTTVLIADVVLDNYPNESFDGNKQADHTHNNNLLPEGTKWDSPIDVLHSGLGMIGLLGVGGMGTRGFGRMSILGKPEEVIYKVEAAS
ncbi:MAG: type III-B CRISPR module RAMP protein Cmr4 [Chlorobiaceae bacterium]|nr:type III-B CRISPR module RAMP protein Cmr4 [Chlorobiaceae bacterium]